MFLLDQLHFLRHVNQQRFVEALALTGDLSRSVWNERELWAAYRLDMHETVARAQVHRPGWRGYWAKAVSFAACGQAEAARDAASALARQTRWGRHLMPLAGSLAPFMPQLALHLIEGRMGVPVTLYASLLLSNGRTAEAQAFMGRSPREGASLEPVELPLLRTNAWGGTHAEQLKRLNAFFSAYALSPVRLVDASQPPSPGNVAAVEPPVRVLGPLVTVLMTTFNTGARASAAIASVRAQSYRNLELIVVDDASTDDTPDLASAAAADDPRVRVLRLPRNVGTYAAKLLGLAQARGEFVTCHDSDDWSHPEKIARQVAPLLADERLVCTTSNWVRMQDDGEYYARKVHPLLRLNPSSPLFRRQRVLHEAGAWDCVRTGADSEFLARLRVVFGPKAIKKIGQPLALGSHRPDSLMTATDTGYSASGISPQRLAYWEAWARWHIEELACGRRPFVPAEPMEAAKTRPFPVPNGLRVLVEDVAECVSSVSASRAECMQAGRG